MPSKISRLPANARAALNRRLDDGDPASIILPWLNRLRKHIGKPDPREKPITKQNLSAWRQSGYREWRNFQEAKAATQRVGLEATELQAAVPGPVADQVATWLTSKYVVAAKKFTDEDGSLEWERLRELTKDIAVLRRGDHQVERLRLQRDRFDYEKAEDAKDQNTLFWEWTKLHEVRKELAKTFVSDEERIELLGRAWLGNLWYDFPKPDCPHCKGRAHELPAYLARRKAEMDAEYLAKKAQAAGEVPKDPNTQAPNASAIAQDQTVAETPNPKHPTPVEPPNTKHQTSDNPQNPTKLDAQGVDTEGSPSESKLVQVEPEIPKDPNTQTPEETPNTKAQTPTGPDQIGAPAVQTQEPPAEAPELTPEEQKSAARKALWPKLPPQILECEYGALKIITAPAKTTQAEAQELADARRTHVNWFDPDHMEMRLVHPTGWQHQGPLRTWTQIVEARNQRYWRPKRKTS